MHRSILFIFSLILVASANAQCLTIESILADACGNPEGANEMVRFSVGNTDLPISDITFDWPNNTFLGWCPEPVKTIQLNNTIISSCGYLLEPDNGIVPANSTVIAISSTDFDVAANSFEGLTDTVYLLFQCAGNTLGHFSNSASTTRTLVIEVNGACNGSDNASYLGTSLIGGDGAAVEYIGNNVNYVNYGCNAPFLPLNANWDLPDIICDDYGAIDLTQFFSGAIAGGTFTGPNVTNNTFNPFGLYGDISINYEVSPQGNCAESIDSTVTVFIDSSTTTNDTIYACDSYTFNGVSFDTSQYISVVAPSNTPYGCDTNINRLVIIESVTYEITPSTAAIVSGEAVAFEVLNEDAFLNVTWMNQFGEQCTEQCFEDLYPTENNSIYVFTLENTQNNCTTTDTIVVAVSYFSELNIPTVFTPNGDGQNDVFKVYGKDIASADVRVFDQWGGLLFQTTDINQGWDGTAQGKRLPAGAYFLGITAIGKDGQRFDIYQPINLIR